MCFRDDQNKRDHFILDERGRGRKREYRLEGKISGRNFRK